MRVEKVPHWNAKERLDSPPRVLIHIFPLCSSIFSKGSKIWRLCVDFIVERHHHLQTLLVVKTLIANVDEGLTPTKDGGTCLRTLSMFRKEVH